MKDYVVRDVPAIEQRLFGEGCATKHQTFWSSEQSTSVYLLPQKGPVTVYFGTND